MGEAKVFLRSNRKSRRSPRAAGLWSWALYDWANNAFATVVVTFVFAAYFVRQVAPNEPSGSAAWGYMLGFTGIIIATIAPILGAIADHSGRTKIWIGGFTVACVSATAGLWWVLPSASYLWLALVLVGAGMIASEFANVFITRCCRSSRLPSLSADGPGGPGDWVTREGLHA